MRHLSAQRLLARCARSRVAASFAAFVGGGVLALPLVLSEGSASAAGETSLRLATTATMLALPVAPAPAPALAIDVEPSPPVVKVPVDATPRFNGRPIRVARTMTMRVTAYSPDARSCGDHADGITASGYSVLTNGGKLVAADTSVLPFGSLVSIPGYDAGAVVPVLDRGGAIKGNRLDVLFPTHEEARLWGVRDLEVTVWEYADGQPNGFREYHWSWRTAR
jgi:3D (Asp-Asp-Asp) domain-containing protein